MPENWDKYEEDLYAAIDAAALAERESILGIVARYIANPVGDERNETAEAFLAGMTYRTGGTDNAIAIEAAIRNRSTDDDQSQV